MTLKNILDRLSTIDGQAQTLMRDIGLKDDDYEPWANVIPDSSDPDELFLYNELRDLMSLLCRIHRELIYLDLPCGDTHVLRLFPNGRYGYQDLPFDNERTFSCGAPVEALINDDNGNPCWVSSRIEHNGNDYYLYGYRDITLNGLMIRERRPA